MKDLEIVKLLTAITPESEEQKQRLFVAIKLFKKYATSANLYLNELPENFLLNKEFKKVYQQYKEWCEIKELIPASAIEFSKCVHINCNVKTKVVKINGKCVRVFESS